MQNTLIKEYEDATTKGSRGNSGFGDGAGGCGAGSGVLGNGFGTGAAAAGRYDPLLYLSLAPLVQIAR